METNEEDPQARPVNLSHSLKKQSDFITRGTRSSTGESSNAASGDQTRAATGQKVDPVCETARLDPDCQAGRAGS